MRALSLLCVAVPLVGAVACFQPDGAALAAKLQGECRTLPSQVPLCACATSGDDAAVCDEMFARWAAGRVDSAEEQDCILALDCDEGPGANVADDVAECLRKTSSDAALFAPDRDPTCAAACGDDAATGECSAANACTLDEATACEQARSTCVDAC